MNNERIRKQKNKSKNYTMIDNSILQNQELSWKAKGLLCYLISLPDDWTIYISHLIKQSSDGEKSIRSGLKELQKNNYLQRYPVYLKGRIKFWESIVCEIPFKEEEKIHCIKIDENGNEEILLCQNRKVAQSESESNIELLSQKVKVEKIHVEKRDTTNNLYNKELSKQINNNNHVDGVTNNLKQVSKEKVIDLLNNLTKIGIRNIDENIAALLIYNALKYSEDKNLDYISCYICEKALISKNVKKFKSGWIAWMIAAVKNNYKADETLIAKNDNNDKPNENKDFNTYYSKPSKFNNFLGRQYDFEELERLEREYLEKELIDLKN